jgi:uncharacterized damage-inducible protein DinB
VATIIDHLDGARRHVLGIVEGLDEQAMRRPVLPSGWACRDLLHHLTHDDERFWVRGVIGGDPAIVDTTTHQPVEGWRPDPALSAQTVLALYREEIEQGIAVLAAADLDAPPRWWPDFFGERWVLRTTRDVLLHLLTETATHAGHLDAARELIDGQRWVVIDDPPSD